MVSGAKAVGFSVSVTVNPHAYLPPGLRIELRSGPLFYSIPIDSPAPQERSYGDLLGLNSKMDLSVFTGRPKPIRLQANVSDGTKLLFDVQPKLRIEGRIQNTDVLAVCQVKCLNDGKTAGPGECVECENEDVVVELCC
jgi:hypothetical protein